MKKIIFFAMFIFGLCLNVCSANSYDENPDYVYVVTENGGTHYLNLKTIDVIQYRPPQYQIAGYFVHVSPKADGTEKISSRYVCLLFEWDTKEIFHKDNYGNWEKSYTEGDTTNALVNRKFADALFHAAYNMNFFGY